MNRRRFAALASGLVLLSGAAQAATFNFNDTIAAGEYRAYTFDFGDNPLSPVYASTPVVLGTYWFTDGDYDVIGYQDYIANYSCNPSTGYCFNGGFRTRWEGVYSGNVLSLYVDNRNYNFDVCKENHAGIDGVCFSYALPLGVVAFNLPDDVVVTVTSGAVPEPATWAMMILGFGVIGAAMRGRRLRESAA